MQEPRWRSVDLRSDPDEDGFAGDPADLVDAGATLLEILRRPAWHAQAVCRGQGTGRWFPSTGQPAGPGKRVCAGCPVRQECLSAAMADPMTIGTWGGRTAADRRRMRQGVPLPEPKRRPVPAAQLVAFVDAVPGLRWPQRLERWNLEHPERPFPTANAMAMAWRYVRAAHRLEYPQAI